MPRSERYLITGFSGFVSKHFLELLEQKGATTEICGIDVNVPEFDFKSFNYLNCQFSKVDLLDKSQVEKTIVDFKPDYILHLASFSSVAYSWKEPANSFVNNTNIFLNLLEAVRQSNIKCRILSIGSSEEYGNVKENELPLKEEQMLRPLSPYAVARVSQEMLSSIYSASYDLDIVMTRSFNHVGTGQKDVFVVPSFARQLLSLKEKKTDQKVLITGDTTIVRDFIDVRDVVKAYYLLFKKGKKGSVYNICSGTGTSLNEVIAILSELLNISITHTIDANLIRPNDNRIIIGDNSKIKIDTGWAVEIDLKQSLADILNELRA